MNDVLDQLDSVLKQRKENGDPTSSYVAQLHHKGLNKILEKVGEEATEVIIAAKDTDPSGDKSDIVGETADLWFHSLVMLSHLGLNSRDVVNELSKRFDLSGLAEKASRSSS